MRLISHPSLIKRNTTIGKYVFNGGFVIMFGALAVNVYALLNPARQELIFYVFGLFILGYAMTLFGGAFNNRWGRRPDVGLTDSLRGTDDRWSLYHYRLGASHVLLGPTGVFVLHPKYQAGPIQYDPDKKKWININPTARRGLFGFGPSPDAIGDPVAEAEAEVDALLKFLKKYAPEVEVDPKPIIVFLSSRAVLDAKGSPVLALHVKQLKDHLRKLPKGKSLSSETLAAIEERLKVTVEA